MRALSVIVTVAVMMVVMRVVFENPGADSIYHQPDRGDGDGFAKVNGRRGNEPMNGFRRHEKSYDRQNDGAGEAAEDADFARAECELRVLRVAPAEGISQRRQNKGRHVRAHVP